MSASAPTHSPGIAVRLLTSSPSIRTLRIVDTKSTGPGFPRTDRSGTHLPSSDSQKQASGLAEHATSVAASLHRHMDGVAGLNRSEWMPSHVPVYEHQPQRGSYRHASTTGCRWQSKHESLAERHSLVALHTRQLGDDRHRCRSSVYSGQYVHAAYLLKHVWLESQKTQGAEHADCCCRHSWHGVRGLLHFMTSSHQRQELLVQFASSAMASHSGHALSSMQMPTSEQYVHRCRAHSSALPS